MFTEYSDILDKIPEPPQWWDEHRVPRYVEFAPHLVADIYADEAALARSFIEFRAILQALAEQVHVENGTEAGNVFADIIVALRGRGFHCGVQRDAFHAGQFAFEQRICEVLNELCDAAIGRAAMRWVVFESAILGRIMRRRNDDAIRHGRCPAPQPGYPS